MVSPLLPLTSPLPPDSLLQYQTLASIQREAKAKDTLQTPRYLHLSSGPLVKGSDMSGLHASPLFGVCLRIGYSTSPSIDSHRRPHSATPLTRFIRHGPRGRHSNPQYLRRVVVSSCSLWF